MSEQTIWVLMIIFVVLPIYFIPTIVAFKRSHRNKVAIGFLNLFLGWTLLVWVGSFVWSLIGQAGKTKQCEHCKEAINIEAIFCKYCQKSVAEV